MIPGKKESVSSEPSLTGSAEFFKPTFDPSGDNFNLNFLFVGPSGTGKTDLPARYTKGPVHFYMFDKGGTSTIKKVIKEKKTNNISVDLFNKSDLKFSTFWDKFQEDEAKGYFDYLAENNGILVTDSITKLNIIAKREISENTAKGKTLIGSKSKPIKWTFDEWDTLGRWMQTYMNCIQDLPCATITTVHVVNETDSSGAVVGKSLTLNGAFREAIKIDFDEMYLFERKGNDFSVCMQNKSGFTARSNSFKQEVYKKLTMDDLFNKHQQLK